MSVQNLDLSSPSTTPLSDLRCEPSEVLPGVLTPEIGESGSDSTSEGRKTAPRITCSGCDATWTALGAAHCAAPGCHRTFAGVALFDRHRSAAGGEHGSCFDPGRLINANTGERVMFFRDGMWRGPEMTDELKAKRFGGVTR